MNDNYVYEFTGKITKNRFQNGYVRVFDSLGTERSDMNYRIVDYQPIK